MVDVVSDQTEISYAESVTGWGGDTFTLENEIFVQGSNSVAVGQTTNGANDVYFDKATGSWDVSSSHLRLFLSSNIMPNTHTEANDGIQISAYDGTNTAYWTVGGSDTYSGGWQDFIIDPNTTPTSGSVTLTAVTRVGIRLNTSSKPRNATNGWYDNFRFGNGLECNSTTTEAIDFTDIAVEDGLTANVYNILELDKGVLFAKGKLTLGNAAGSKNCNIVSSNEQIVFEDQPVDTDLYAIVATEGTGATDIDITGLVCKTNGTTAADFDFSASITSFSMKGSTLIDMGLLKFGQGTLTSNTFSGCGATTMTNATAATGTNWTNCGTVTVSNTGSVTDCNFAPATGTTALSVDNLSKIDNCSFTSGGTGHAVELTSVGGGSMTWKGNTSGYASSDGSTGNEDIYVNVGSGSLTISVATGYGTPTIRTAGASVTVVGNQIDFKFTVSPSITGYEWRLYEDSVTPGIIGTVALDGEETATVDNQTYSYTYSTDTAVALQIIASGYEESVTYHTLSSVDQDLTITLESEENI